MRFGLRLPLALGLSLAAVGLLLFVRAPVGGDFVTDVLPSMILLGLGAGLAFNPVLLAAMSDVEPTESGLASGIVNTSFMMGGALGLAILASVAASRTTSLEALGESTSRRSHRWVSRRLPRSVPLFAVDRRGAGRRAAPVDRNAAARGACGGGRVERPWSLCRIAASSRARSSAQTSGKTSGRRSSRVCPEAEDLASSTR